MTNFHKAVFQNIEADGNGQLKLTTEVEGVKYTMEFTIEHMEKILKAAKEHRDKYQNSLKVKL